MSFDDLKETWHKLGEVDPFWAILTDPNKKNNQWDVNLFFEFGRLEVAGLWQELEYLDWPLARGRALDFGCGVGRLTQALAAHFEEAHGVDVAASMIKLANELKSPEQNCHYHLNEKQDLRLFADDFFDFVYSRLVLQHMHPTYSQAYIGEFIRVLRPGGLIAFQLPSGIRNMGEQEAGLAAVLRPSARFAAEITADPIPLQLEPNEQKTLTITLQNKGQIPWLAAAADGRTAIQLGNHWRHENGRMLQRDDGRTPLPYTITPGDAVTLHLTVTAPAAPGDYLLEIDVLQENITWFGDKGSPTLSRTITVRGERIITPPPPPPPFWRRLLNRLLPPPPPDPLPFEMHGIPVTEVQAVIAQNGGKLIAVQYDDAGAEWTSYLYFVTKP